jgi:glutamine synthetase
MVLEIASRPEGSATRRSRSVEELLEFARESGIAIVDLRFTDLPGTWQHFSIPVGELSAALFSDGIGFDGSSIRGFQHIHESDMLLLPDASTAFVDPVLRVPTLAITCDIVDPITRQPYTRDPRYVARKAEAFLPTTGIATTSFWGPEIEFYIFNSLRFDQDAHSGYHYIDSEEGIWNSGSNGVPNLGHRPRHKEGYFPVPPADRFQDLRSDITAALIAAGIEVEVHHHEVGTAGQSEIDLRFGNLVETADKVLTYKYVAKNVAHKAGYVVTFMPKPMYGDNGSGMHTHQSLWDVKKGRNAFADEKDSYGLSTTARSYIAGILEHARGMIAVLAPLVNSYKRLVPGYEAPVYIGWARINRSALIRIPQISHGQLKSTRIELRCPDPASNPYLAFACMLAAGLDGIDRKLTPPEPVEENLYHFDAAKLASRKIRQLPGTLSEALSELRGDLVIGEALGEHVFERFVEAKTEEWDEYRMQVTSWEIERYLEAF